MIKLVSHFLRYRRILSVSAKVWTGALAVTCGLGAPGLVHAAAGSFSGGGTLTAARQQHTATLLPNGRLLVAGGTSGSAPLASSELYDPNLGTWAATAGPMGAARQGHVAVMLSTGKVLVAGGLGSGGAYLSSSELFDPSTGLWSPTTAPLNTARANGIVTLLASGKVLFAGGQTTGAAYLNTAEVFDPSTGLWSYTLGTLNTARANGASALLPNGTVLVSGGQGTGGTAVGTAEIFDPVASNWAFTTGTPNAARYLHTATLLANGTVLVAGGQSGASTYLTSSETYDPSSGSWTTTTGPLSTARASASACLLPNGKVLVAGGQGTGASNLASAELYNPATGTWAAATNSMTAARRNHTATVLANARVLLVGGINTSTLASTDAYDLTTGGTWATPNNTLGTGRYNHSITLMANGKVMVAGGQNNGGSAADNSSEYFDPATGFWRATTGLMNQARQQHTATLLPNGKVLIAGGYNGSSMFYSELYDPVSGRWSYTSNLNVARQGHTATLLYNGKVFVAGGVKDGTNLASGELYDPSTGLWTTVPGVMTDARQGHTATLLPNGKVLVAGGVGNPGILSSSEIFDPASGTWTSTSQALTLHRKLHTATLLPNGKVLVAGGASSAGYLITSEVYDPANDTWNQTTGSLNAARQSHAAVLLPTGKVLVAGGIGSTGFLASSELFDPGTGGWTTSGNLPETHLSPAIALMPNGKVLVAAGNGGSGAGIATSAVFDPGLGYSAASQPLVSTATPTITPGNGLVLSGTGFTGFTEGSGGGTQNSSTGMPLVQLQSLVNEQTTLLLPSSATPWSATGFTSVPVTGMPYGYALATVFADGIPSASSIVQITAPAPVVTLSTSSLLATATTLTINGSNFDATTAANNTVGFNDGAVGTVTAATATQITVTFSTKPVTAGPLTVVASTTSFGTTGISTQVATVAPVVTPGSATLLTTASTVTINGFGFDLTAANNTVLFNGSTTGTVTAATATQLTVTFGTKPSTNGPLTAVVTTNGVSNVSAVQVATTDIPVAITTGTLVNWTLNKTNYLQPVLATGGTGTLGFNVSSGTLPTGLSLSSTGVVSGTPTAAGSFVFTVQAVDTLNVSASKGYTIVINPVLAISTTTAPDWTINKIGYSQTLVKTGGTDVTSFAVSGGTLPAGLTLSAAGILSGTPSAAAAYTFTATATDAAGTTASQTYNVNINPAIIVSPSTLPNWVANKTGYSQTITSANGTGTRSLSLTSGAVPTGMTFAAGTGVLNGTPTTPGTYNFTITATDSVTANGSQAYSIVITTPLSISTASLPAWTFNATGYGQSITATGGVGASTFAVTSGTLPTGMALSSAGLISGTPTAAGTFSFVVTATDTQASTATKSLFITINPAVLISTGSLASWTINKSGYSQSLSVGSTGTGTSTFAVTSGALPTGLALSTAGVLTGTPIEANSFPFTITATDSVGATGSKAYTVIINPAVTVGPATLPDWTVGKSGYAQTVTSANGTGTRTLSLTSGAVPSGMLFTASTGVLNGTPTVPGVYSFTITATDAVGATALQAYTVTINPPVVISTATLSAWTVNAPGYLKSITATGGTGALSYTSTTLPAGLVLGADGTLSGTPTAAGTFNFTVTATDTVGASGSKNLSLVINPAIVVTPAALVDWTVNTSGYSKTIASTGGTGTVVLAVTSGAVPTGLTLNSSGLLSGTPTEANTFNFTVTATDTVGGTGFKGYSITINPPVSIATATLPNWTSGKTGYSRTLTVTGGTGADTFAVTAGTLPAGLSLSGAGVLAGNPTATGSYSFTITATDAVGATGLQAYTIVINPPVNLATTSVPDWTANDAGYSQMFTAAGGTGVLKFSVTGGALPTGLALADTGLLSGTPTTAGTFNFTVTVTDTVGATAFKGYSVVIAPEVGLSPVTLRDWTINTSGYSQTITSSAGTGARTLALTDGAVPTGLAFTPASGVLSGTPTAAGTFNFTITATDSVGAATTRAYNVTINPAVAIITPSLAAWTISKSGYSQSISASNGTGAKVFSASGNALPPGLSLSSGGVLSGTPTTAGTFTFTVTATDTVGATGSLDCSVVINPAVVLAPTSLPDWTMGSSFQQTITKTGGTGACTFVISTGTQPAGLSLSSGGVLSGTPTTAGTYTFTITATDAVGATGSTSYTLQIHAGVAITTASLPTGTFKKIYDQNFAAQGGIPPLTFAVTSGSLPAGLSLTSDGKLSGTPMAGGSFAFTVTATDHVGAAGQKAFALAITAILPELTALPAADVTGTSAILGANVTSDGGATTTALGVVLAPAAANKVPKIGSEGVINIPATPGAAGVYVVDATSLKPGTVYNFAAYATNSAGTTYSQGTFTTQSNNAGLAKLVLSKGTLVPAFSTGTFIYKTSASVANNVTSLTLTPTAAQAGATITVNGTPVFSGSVSGSLPLLVGPNVLVVTVIAQDNVTTQSYTVTISRQGPPVVAAPTSALVTGTQALLGGTVVMDGGLAITATGVVLAPSALNASPQKGGAGVVDVPGAPTTGVFTLLAAGLTPVTGYSFAAYATNSLGTSYSTVGTFTTPSNDATLASLVPSAGSLSPVFAPATTSYVAYVPNTTASITLTPTVNQPDATVSVNGTTVASATASAALPLNVGPNTVTVVVTAQDHTTKSYTVVVKRLDLAQLSVELAAGTVLINGGTPVDFGYTGVGSGVSVKTFTIRNLGTSDLTSASISKDGANQAMFTLLSSPVVPVVAGGTTTFTVQFTPTTLTKNTAALHLTSNDRANSPFDIPLTGTGIQAVPPVVTTTAATGIDYHQATLNASVNAKGAARTVYFDYGLTTAYGNTITLPSQVTGTLATTVNTVLTGLLPNTKYNYRVRATAMEGSATGANLTFTTPNPAALLGTYTATIARDATVNGGLGGLLTFTVATSGPVTGTLKNGASSTAFTGSIIPGATPSGTDPLTAQLTVLIPKTPLSSYVLVVNLNTPSTALVSGTLSLGSAVAHIDGVQQVWSQPGHAAATDYAGTYTLALEPSSSDAAVPQGDGYLTFTVSTTGVVTWAGQLADGTLLSAGTTNLGPNGEVPLFASLYTVSGSLLGTPQITAVSRTTSGSLTWSKTGQPASARAYQAGFGALNPVTLSVIGGRYLAPGKGSEVLPGVTPPGGAQITFADGGIASVAQFSNLTQPLAITNSVAALSPEGNPAGIKISKINPADGTFTGTFTLSDPNPFSAALPKVSRKVTFNGVFLQGAPNVGTGYFLLPSMAGPPVNVSTSPETSGQVTITPK